MKRILAKAGLIGALLAVPLALPAIAAAKPHGPKQAPEPVYTYTARIDCGWGPLTVLSTDDLYAPLFDPASGRSYQPVAWDVVYDGERIEDSIPGGVTKHARLIDCSYDDGGAVGTVTILRPHGRAVPKL
jgi:hypothetical protein